MKDQVTSIEQSRRLLELGVFLLSMRKSIKQFEII